MAIKNMTREEKRWQAEGDAHTLARAQEIQADKGRMGAAKKVAGQQAKELQKQTRAMQNVANRGTSNNPANKTAIKKTTAKKSSGTRPKNSGKASRGGRRK